MDFLKRDFFLYYFIFTIVFVVFIDKFPNSTLSHPFYRDVFALTGIVAILEYVVRGKKSIGTETITGKKGVDYRMMLELIIVSLEYSVFFKQ